MSLIKRDRFFVKNTQEYFGDAYNSVSKLVYCIRENLDLLADLLIKAEKYINSLDGQFEILIETVVHLFFEDFNNSEEATSELYMFLTKIIEVLNSLYK